MHVNRAMDFSGVCDNCIAQHLCAGSHGPCLAAAEGANDSVTTGVISPRDHRLHDWMADLGGTLELDYSPPQCMQLDLSPYIPVLERQSPGLSFPQMPYYGVHMDAAITPKRMDLTDCARNTRAYFRVPPETKMALFCYGRDSAVEELWARRHSDRLIEKLLQTDFDLIVAPNFSVYLSQPRMTHLIRIRMSHILYRDMVQAGLPVIPHIYFGAQEDIKRWGEWLGSNPQVTTVACNLQTAVNDRFFSWMIAGLGEIRQIARRDVHFVISGPSCTRRIEEVCGALGPKLTITNCLPHQVAAKRHVLWADGQREFRQRSYRENLATSLESMEDIIEQAALSDSPVTVTPTRVGELVR